MGPIPWRFSSRSAAAHAAAGGAVALATLLLHWVPGASHVAIVPLVYLLVVLGLALRLGRWPAITASVLSFLAFDWFFVEPRHTLTVSNPAEWVALLAFLLTSVVIGHLTVGLRSRAEEARLREQEAAALAEVSWAVAAQPDRDRALGEVVGRVRALVAPAAVCVLARSETGEWVTVGRGEAGWTPNDHAWEERARALVSAMTQPADDGLPDGVAGPLVSADPTTELIPLQADRRLLGVLCLSRRPGTSLSPQQRRAVESLANLAAVVIERDCLARAEGRARALAEADRLKTALLSMVSHDFRSPLASIKVTASALQEPSLDTATRRELLLGIEQEADRLNRIVGNLLALSRLEADAWRPLREPTSPSELIGMALGAFSPEQNERIRVKVDPSLPEALLDPVQICQVLHNLVDNALKYSPPGAPVEVEAVRTRFELLLEVRDSGPGLAEGEEVRAFEPFYRGSGLGESAVPGVGIGLAVCRGLVEAHGGALTAGNRRRGGAAFVVRLPIGEAGAPAPVEGQHARAGGG